MSYAENSTQFAVFFKYYMGKPMYDVEMPKYYVRFPTYFVEKLMYNVGKSVYALRWSAIRQENEMTDPEPGICSISKARSPKALLFISFSTSLLRL